MRITEEIMNHISDSANLEWKTEDKEGIKSDFLQVIRYMEKLAELDTNGIEPLSHLFSNGNVFREDEVTNGEQKERQFIVPKTV